MLTSAYHGSIAAASAMPGQGQPWSDATFWSDTTGWADG
jgi:hypothetical protein